MLYLLSKLIPVPMRSTYRVLVGPRAGQRVTTTWWQWRDRVWSVRTVPVLLVLLLGACEPSPDTPPPSTTTKSDAQAIEASPDVDTARDAQAPDAGAGEATDTE